MAKTNWPDGTDPGIRAVGHEAANEMDALYVYCIVPDKGEFGLGKIGIDASEVFSIPGDGLSAVVHQCPALPYQTQDREIAAQWVAAHHRVVEDTWKRFGSVLPMSFDMLIEGDDCATAREKLVLWMREKRGAFTGLLGQLAGKAEYGVQISWDPRDIAADLLEHNHDLQALEKEFKAQSEGAAFLGQAKLEKAIKIQMEALAGERFQAYYSRISGCAHALRLDRPLKAKDNRQMLLNVSCLLEKGDHGRLGRVLDLIAAMKGMKVRFTGPWPPYSFVSAA